MTSSLERSQARAREWCHQDPNEETSNNVKDLLDRTSLPSGGEEKDRALLMELFPTLPDDGSVSQQPRISFGTAGLRSAMKPGPMGMNDLVVIQAAQGIAKYCIDKCRRENDGKKICAVVGYDHRSNPDLQLSSLSFALLTALVFTEAGMGCLLLDGFVATPLVAFGCTSNRAGHLMSAIQHSSSSEEIEAVVGIMITASHNPKQDAGYKVYWKGCQIRPPMDQEIAQSIYQNLEPWADYGAKLKERRMQSEPNDSCLGLSTPELTKKLVDDYFEALKSSGLVTGQYSRILASMEAGKDDNAGSTGNGDTSKKQKLAVPKFCYTAMHGVGYPFAKRSFATFGLPDFVAVPEQQEPDHSFPTVSFPNPEEKGALDLAKAYAEKNGCHIVLANDPDADRLAVAECSLGTWTVFTGDQIGTMLGHWLFKNYSAADTESEKRKPVLAMCASTVSSKMLAEIARVEGFYFEDTLTGFKWIGSRAQELHASGSYQSIFCYEEAIGFCCGNVIFDKDGVSALSVFAELSFSVYSQGLTISQHMQSLYDTYGEFVSNNGYYFVSDTSVVKAIMEEVTNHGKFDTLDTVGPYVVTSIRYLGEPGYDSTTKDKKATLPTSASSPMLTLYFENGCVAQFRASGTEPKFKYYIELKGKPGVSRETVTKDLQEMSACILEELLKPSKNGLQLPG